MHVFAVMNQKGGSAKTTTTVNMAAAFGAAGHQALVVDLDPQASASAWLGVRDGGRGLLDVLTTGAELAPLVQASSAEGVDVVPASSWLVGAERAMASEVGAETVFRGALSKLSGPWAAVFIDCPPTLGLLSVSALTAAHTVLVPVEARVMALAGLSNLGKTVDRVRERLNPGLQLSHVLACRVDGRTNLAGEVVERLRAHFGERVLKRVIRENVRLAEAPSFYKSIISYAPTSTGAEDYQAAGRELWARLQNGG